MFLNATTLIFSLILLGLVGVVILLARYGQENLVHGGSLTDEDVSGVPALDFQSHVQAGDALFHQYRYQEALSHYNAAVKMNDQDKGVLFRMGKIYQLQEKYPRAEMAFKRVLQINANAMEALYELARMYYKLGRQQAAYKMVINMLTLDSTHREALQLKARILLERKEYPEVIGVLQHLLKDDPENIELQSLLARSLYHAKNYQDALGVLETLYTKEVSDRRNAKYYTYLVYEATAMYDKAITTLQDILNSGTGTISQGQVISRLGHCWIKKAEACEHINQINEAIDCLQKALSIDPMSGEVYAGLGKLYFNQNNREAALENLIRAVELGSEDVTVFYDLARLFEARREMTQAIEHMHRAARLMPSPQMYFHLGTFYGLNGDMDNCIAYLERAIAKDPEYIDAHYNLGVAQEQVGAKAAALKTYKHVLKLDRNHPEAKTNFDALRSGKKK